MTERQLLKDLIHIPERVHQGDFVLKLTEGVEDPEATLNAYIVTPQLERCFDEALAFVESAIASHSSKACYLHGSFGAGKSHFMAVLNLLLAGHGRARSIRELAKVIARHNEWTQGKKFLMVPYHMVGARDMESAVLGQYAEHVRRLHPEAPVPGFYLAQSLFDDAKRLRTQMGDDKFFARLADGQTEGDDGWGALAGGWDAESFESAMLEPPKGEERQRLIGDLIERFFASYERVAADRGEAFVSLDEGLSIMSGHAQRLGYDAVVLFLDELILWLATRAADVNFVASEGQKLVKLVEAQRSDRPIPLVSFVARQRDLRDLVGDNLAGALQLQFADVLKHWEARFHRITLEDRNLPLIARERLLKPVSETAEKALDVAFETFASQRHDVLETLLGSTGERAIFRDVYPFSPALVQTLIAVSSLLQRERTALKLMLQLLVERREELEVGMIISVGDLWDAIAEGDEPFTEGTRLQFENAKKLWTQKLLPLLERHHGVSWQALQEGDAEPQAATSLRNDARLLKTLLLAALVPEVESLKALTPERLAALNHGSVRSPLAKREGSIVLAKLRQWASEIGEIKFETEDNNPVITVQITGVDTEPVLANAAQYDNEGNRRRRIREMLFQEFGIEENDGLLNDFNFVWRGTRRQIDIVHDNVHELGEDRLRGRDENWTVVIGLPFDRQHTPADAKARLDNVVERARTVVWLPSHLSAKADRELGILVRVYYLLRGERFDDAARHLSASDRNQARALLKNQQSQLLQRLRNCLEVAYGIVDQPADAVDSPLDPTSHLSSLDGTFEPQLPVGANLGEAFRHLLDQLFANQFPAHPQFDQEVRPVHLRKVYEVVQAAIVHPEHRVFVADKGSRQLLSAIANLLDLGTMGATHFVLGHHWPTHFARLQGQHGGPITVLRLRQWTDQPRAMGLTREVQNLIILTYAEQTNRSFFQNGVAVPPSLERLDDELVLREQALPPANVWARARERAGALFGLTPPEVLSAVNVSLLADTVLMSTREATGPLSCLEGMLEARIATFARAVDDADRMVTARSAIALLDGLEAAGDSSEVVEVLAGAEIRTSETAMAGILAKAAELETFLIGFDWDSLETLERFRDHRRAAAEAIRSRTVEALIADEHATPLKPALELARKKALQLLTETSLPAPADPAPSLPKIDDVREVEIAAETHTDVPASEALAMLTTLEHRLEAEIDGHLSIQWRLTRKIDGE